MAKYSIFFKFKDGSSVSFNLNYWDDEQYEEWVKKHGEPISVQLSFQKLDSRASKYI